MSDVINVHQTAIIDPQAVIADDVVIGPYCVIKGNVTIESGTILENHVTINGTTTIGKKNHIFPGAVIGVIPQDLKYVGEKTEVVIGSNNQIREYVTIHQATEGGGGKTIVGDGNLIMAYSHVAHDCILGNNIVMANSVQLAGHCLIEDNVIIAGMSGLHHFTSVGAYAFIGGMTRINKDVPPYMMIEGNPSQLFGANVVGLRRNGLTDEDVSAVKKAARIMYKADNNISLSIQRIEEEEALTQNSHVQHLLAFIKKTAAGENGRALEGSH